MPSYICDILPQRDSDATEVMMSEQSTPAATLAAVEKSSSNQPMDMNIYATRKTAAQGKLLSACNYSEKHIFKKSTSFAILLEICYKCMHLYPICAKLIISKISNFISACNYKKIALNKYEKVFAQVHALIKLLTGMMALAMLIANASQLKYVLLSWSRHRYFQVTIALISLSIVLQVAKQGLLSFSQLVNFN